MPNRRSGPTRHLKCISARCHGQRPDVMGAFPKTASRPLPDLPGAPLALARGFLSSYITSSIGLGKVFISMDVPAQYETARLFTLTVKMVPAVLVPLRRSQAAIQRPPAGSQPGPHIQRRSRAPDNRSPAPNENQDPGSHQAGSYAPLEDTSTDIVIEQLQLIFHWATTPVFLNTPYVAPNFPLALRNTSRRVDAGAFPGC